MSVHTIECNPLYTDALTLWAVRIGSRIEIVSPNGSTERYVVIRNAYLRSDGKWGVDLMGADRKLRALTSQEAGLVCSRNASEDVPDHSAFLVKP